MLKRIWGYVLRQRAHYVNKNYRSYVVTVQNGLQTPEYVLVFKYIQHWKEQGFIITMNRTTSQYGRFVASVACFDMGQLHSETLLSAALCEIGSKYGYFENL